ncbi:PucR family transcriptional regulator [Proteiniborus sp. MB09-C3]|uniref:PucR family transcriptional regulator n=1 Tax=Proteiniborus sp. MB09-C3 TaxID=3050072 RepID=UPI00255490AD|nr:PucR family transcriptional regulator [Proteiniborus sp. MB09-C3]WIV12566.1 PucR family transcriptional regulator ligand-binding domain-containing protein [Proteiniborus sp. MB09-C3]
MGRQNGITIEDALNMEYMKNCKLIAGFKGIRNTISKVNVMADPDILSWVDEGELLLTTAYSFKKDNIEEQKNLIRECSKKKLAGIGIKIYPYLESLSEEVISLADDLNFPIIDLYYATPLSDIMTPLFNEIFNRQAYLLKKIEKIYEQFMDAMLRGANTSQIVKLISDSVKNPVYVRFEFPEEIITDFDYVDDSIKELLLENAEKYFSPISDRLKEKKLEESNELIGGKYIKRMVFPIVAKDSIYGHIVAWSINTPLGGYDLSVLEIASTTMALEILKALSVREVENKYKSEFLDDLISLEEKRIEKAIERATFFNINRKDKFVSITLKIKNREEISNKVDITSSQIQQYITKIHDLLERNIIKELGLNAIVVSKTERIQILLSLKKETLMEPLLEEINKGFEEIIDKFKDLDFRIGIGRPYEGLENFNNSYLDSVKAINTGKILNNKTITNFENLGIFKILCQDHIENELIKFYNSTLRPLVEYDEKKSTELVKTLGSYFENNGNLKKMSDSLFTHYNTVLYRIQRINEITKMSLENPNDRLNLEIALKIKQLLKK